MEIGDTTGWVAVIGVASAAVGSVLTLIFTRGAEAYVNILRARAELRKQDYVDLRPVVEELNQRVTHQAHRIEENTKAIHVCELDRATLHVKVELLERELKEWRHGSDN